MASPSFRSSSTAFAFGTAATGLTPTEPAGATSGDWIFASLMIEVGGTSPGTVNTPSGWTPMASITTSAFVIYRFKTLRGGSAPTYAFTWTTGLNGTFKYAEITVLCYSGAVGLSADEVIVDGTPTTATAVDPPSATPLTTDTTALACYYAWAGVAGTPSNAAGYSLRAHGSGFDSWFEDKALATTAAENPGSVNGDASDVVVGATIILASTGGAPAAYVLFRRRAPEEQLAQDERRRRPWLTSAGTAASTPWRARRAREEQTPDDDPRRRAAARPSAFPHPTLFPRKRQPEELPPRDELRPRPWIPVTDPGIGVLYLQVEEVPVYGDEPPRRLRVIPSSGPAAYALPRRRLVSEAGPSDETRRRRALLFGPAPTPPVFARRRWPEEPLARDERQRQRLLPSPRAGASWAAVTITFTW